jgi:hypothetical protein
MSTGSQMIPEFHPDFATPADWARMYRQATGLQVVPAPFPMRSAQDKRPQLARWTEWQKTWAPDSVFDGWFPPNAKPNMGVITGAISQRLLVVDIDDYKGGEGADWWRSVTGDMPQETWCQQTGGGGRQFFFFLPEGVEISSHRTPVVDIRCEGGFALLPPTVHMSGNTYEWLPNCAPWDVEIATAGVDLIAAIRELIESHRRSGGTGGTERTNDPNQDQDAFGNIIDGRETYMRDLIWATVLNLHRRVGGQEPSDEIAHEAYQGAWETYLRRVRTRLEGIDNAEGLEREGRGLSLFRDKWAREMSHWDGKVAKEAAKRPLDEPGPQHRDDAERTPDGRLILTAAEFVAGFKSPEYVIDGMIQRGYLYSLTARTGHGKTAVAMYLTQAVARALPVRDRKVRQGAVLFLAGENPDDVRARFLVLAEVCGFDPANVPIHFIAGVVNIEQEMPRIRAEAERIGDLAMAVVDTTAAYFVGDDSNNNVQVTGFARVLRQLTTLPGKPAVIAPSHPVKNASRENLLPVGGGGFLNEVDGNLTLWSNADGYTTLHWQGKFRGPEFEPLTFRLDIKTSAKVVDAEGKEMPSVVAGPIGDIEERAAEKRQESDEDRLLSVITTTSGLSQADLARACQWVTPKGDPMKSKVHRVCERLAKDKLIERFRADKWKATPKGRKVLGLGED